MALHDDLSPVLLAFLASTIIELRTNADRSLGRPLKDLAKLWYIMTNYSLCVVRSRFMHYFNITKILNVQIL